MRIKIDRTSHTLNNLSTFQLINLSTNFGRMLRQTGIFLLTMAMVACRPHVFTPKPPGYFKIDTPARHEYRVFDEPGFPYTFEYPVYSDITPDTSFQDQKGGNPYWINVNFPGLGGVINITYKQITEKEPLSFLVQKAYDMSFFHHEKADYIDPTFFDNGNKVYGVIYNLGGNVASKFQFTATDSVKNFFRGAMYFDVTPNADSLKPANDFIAKDIQHMLYTLRWKTPGEVKKDQQVNKGERKMEINNGK